MKWYHASNQKAIERYLSGYYPNHNRVPNFVVRALYAIGYFFGDFVPLILNFIEAVYASIKRLVAFIVGLLVEASIFIVLIGSVVFSISHSIVRLRIAGATSGLEYVGVAMFEVIFISSAATLTGFLMKKKIPNGFIEWLGLVFTLLGFLVGLGFVWWANYNGMAPTWEGRIIGSAVPLLVLIGEGVLAYRYFIEAARDDQAQLLEVIQRNELTPVEVMKAISMYLSVQKSDTGQTDRQTNTDKNVRTDAETDRHGHPSGHSDGVRDGQMDTVGQEAKETSGHSDTVRNEQTDTDSGQLDTIGHSIPDTVPDSATDTDESRDGHSDSEQAGRSDTRPDTSGQTVADTNVRTNTDENSGQSDAFGHHIPDTDSGQTDKDGHHVPDSDSDTDARTVTDTRRQSDADPDTSRVSGGQIDSVRSRQSDTDKSVRTKSNVVPFKNTKSDSSDIEKAKQFALDYYKHHGKFLSVRKLAEAANIKKHQAEKICKELKEELATVGVGQ